MVDLFLTLHPTADPDRLEKFLVDTKWFKILLILHPTPDSDRLEKLWADALRSSCELSTILFLSRLDQVIKYY